MKLNLPFIKMIIKILILLILIVMLSIISAFLYSAKYWPDVYNYMNANITIKRIPKISETENLTIVEEVTEIYRTTSLYENVETTTITDFETIFEDFDLDDINRKKRNVKIEVPKDYSEVPKSEVLIDYIFDVGYSTTDKIKDLVNEDKLTTRDTTDVEIISGISNTPKYFKDVADKCSNNTKNVTEAIFPWIAAIFIKNDTSDQFDYYCDGALLSENIVITAARCMEYYGREVNANNLLVLLGKSSLQSMSGTERAVKVKSIIIHENFTKEATSENDIAILLMEGVPLNEHIQTACLAGEKGLEAVTTGWAISGELTIIPFDADQSSNCKVSRIKKICAAYGNDVTICPSYGGVYAVKQRNGWYLQGIRSGDPSDRGLCFDRSVYFTDLSYYVEWIDDNISN
ncbi:chymotrypsin-like elastase family member 2A isoform X2 [Maniola hyperantus]|uniref:chymotrypsin-like elastase family member 2A isoform X2 n=1 Tax=Aphantopus hyperantus TaxID=2795564 RepID=UPI001569F655|nr:serine protease 44-like isoform X2 [Maniola hyperantus]